MNEQQYKLSQQILAKQTEYAQLMSRAQAENDLDRLRDMMLERNALVKEVNDLRAKLNESAS